MTAKTNTGSDEALKRKQSSTNGVNLGVDVDNTTYSKPLSDFNRLIPPFPARFALNLRVGNLSALQ